jgi:hypothetical protein
MAPILKAMRGLARRRWLALLALVLALLLGVQGLRYAAATRLGRDLAGAVAESDRVPERGEVPDVKTYDPIASLGEFGKKPPPKPKLFGILGNTAFLGQSDRDAKPFQKGAKLPGDYELIEVGIDSVVIKKDDKEETLRIFPLMPGVKPGGSPPAPAGAAAPSAPRMAAPVVGQMPAAPPTPTAEANPERSAARTVFTVSPMTLDMEDLDEETRARVMEAREEALRMMQQQAGE